jgi:4-amino-4-deoxy-L-arabinose transferase-like glycosyltransferase
MIIILLCALATTVPFITKAFHIDDTYYFAIIKAILNDPARPYSFWINWTDLPEFGFSGRFPPLFCYILSPVYFLFGPNPIALHGMAIAVYLMGVFGFYKLCKECALDPIYPTLVYTCVPLFSVGLNIMLDIPALSFSVMAVLMMMRGKKKTAYYWGAGIFLLAALLTKYSALTLLPAMLVYAWASRNKGAVIPVIIAGTGFLVWNLYTDAIYGQMHFFNSAGNAFKYYRVFLLHPLAFVLIIGTFFPYAIVCLRKGRRLWTAVALGSLTTVGLAIYWRTVADIPTAALTGLGIALGSAFCMQWIRWAKSTKDQPLTLFFATWIIMVLVMNLVAASFVAARNVLIMLPALIIPLFQWIQDDAVAHKRLSRLLPCMFILSLALGYSDYRYAGVYPKAAETISSQFSGKTIWYTGHWGWQFYADQHGFQSLSAAGPEPRTGDIVIIPEHVDQQTLPNRITQRLKQSGQLQFPASPWPLQTQSNAAHAGFYATEIFRPPFSFSLAPLEIFDIYIVQ